ncbi:Dabb family protein [Pseudochrobactrum sp. B5]|uniref:Dabb family protein n=1 Tax=Pseudochrobactrum sp. B5 TaxID=1289478 RepID=UPI0009518C8C|nr:Dabb family protein [Pseudochrobactrum sp. B5]
MIRHCVFIHFKASVSQAEKDAIFAEIVALKFRLKGLLAVHLGKNVSPETGMDKGYSEGFIVDFADAESRDTYLADPEHQKTGAKIVAAAQGGTGGVLVYDLEIKTV